MLKYNADWVAYVTMMV